MSRYGQLVYTICLRNCGNPFDAEDLMQETFLAVYKGLDEFEREKEQAWICRIALNKCLDFLKSAGRRQLPTEEAYFEQEVDKRAIPEQMYSVKISFAAACAIVALFRMPELALQNNERTAVEWELETLAKEAEAVKRQQEVLAEKEERRQKGSADSGYIADILEFITNKIFVGGIEND